MKKTLSLLLVASALGLAAVELVADDDEERHEAHEREHYGERDHDDDHEHRARAGASGSANLSDPRYALYKTECGDCHMSFPPSMLPGASWRAMMGNLENHFGDNAELDEAIANRITTFLIQNSADKARGNYAERSRRATQGRPPLRITQTDYFLGQHHEIPARMVEGNPDVASFSRCETCHRGAEQGDFDEHGVRIPGYGRWDD